MGKPFWRSVEYFFTGNYSADDGNNNIVAIGFGGQIHAYGGDDHVTVGSIGATVYTGSGNDTVVGGSAYLKVEDSTGHLTVKGAAGYADINKSGDGNVSFAGAAGGVSIDHLGNHGDISYGGAAAYNGITRKGLSGNVTFAGAGGYNALWHETNQGNLSFTGAGAGNKLDRTWFNRYQGSHGDVTFDGAGAANSISSRVETGNITFRGAGADNHLVRKGKVGDITLQGAGASNRIERTHQAEDVYTQTRGNIRFEGVGGYNSLYSDVAHGDIHFSGGGAYNTIIRKGSGNDFAKEGMTNAKADEIVLTKAVMSGSWIGQDHHVTAVKSASEPNTYLFAFADSTYTKINKVQLRNDPQTGELKYYSTAWYKEGNHLSNLANQDISDNGGFTAVNINGAYTLSDLKVEHQQSVTVHAVEKSLTEYEWVTYANGAVIDAKEVSLSDAKMGGHAIYADGTKVDVKAVKSNRQPNTYVYAKVLGPYTKIVVVELANDPETGALKYQARSWYKEGDHTANIANQDISSATGYNPMGKGGYSLSDLHYSVNAVRSTSETVADIEEYTDQTLFKPANDSGESSGDVRFNGAGGGNVIKSNVTRGNVHFNGGGIANVILHSSQFGNTEFNGGGAANVIVKSGEEGDLTFRGAGLANVLVHQSQQGKMDVYAGGAVNVLVRLGDGQYLAHLLAYGNISVQKGSGDSRVVMLGGYNTHTQIGSGNGLWLAAGGFNVMTQVGQGDVAAVLAGGANVLTKMGEGELTSGMLGGANVITHISNDDQLSNTTAVALGGANILTKKGKGNTLAVMGGGANVLTHVGDGTTTGVMVGGANILTKVGNGDTTGILLGVGNVLTHVGDGQTLGVMGAAGNIFTKVGDGTSIAVMIGAGNIFTHVGEGNAWALMGGLGNVFTKVGNGDALALMVAEANVFTHIGDGMSVALMLAKGNVATKVGNGTTLAAMVGNANIFTHVGSGSTFAAMIGQANIMTKVGNDLTAALMVGKANIMTHIGDGTSLGLFAGEVNVMTKVGNGTTLAAMFGKANIMTHVGDGLTGVLALGEANIVTKVGDDFMGVVAAAKANVVTHVGDAITAAVLAGKGNILTKVGEGTTVGLLISDVGNVMTHVGEGTTIGIAKGKANLITKVGDGLGVNVAWGQANVFTQVGDGDRYNFAKGEANLISKVGDGQEVSVVQGEANIITHVGNGDDYTGAWGKANVITKVGHGQNVVLAKGEANIVTQVGDGDSFNALWSKGNIVTKVGDGMQVTAAKGQANITTTVGNGLNVTAAYGDANINTKVGDGVSVNVAWGKYNINTKVGDGLNVAVMKGKANANIHVGDGLNINASYAQNNVAIKVGNGDFYSLAVASSNTSSNKLSALFDNIKQTVLGVGGSQAINYLVQGDEASSSGTHKGRGAIATPEITKLDGFQMDAIKEVSSDLGDSLTGSVTKVDTPDLNKMQHALNVDDSSVQAPNLIVNGDFELGEHGWQSTHGVEASYAGSVYGVEGEGHGARVTELDTYTNTSLYQDLANLAQGEVIAVSFDFAKRAGLSNNEGIDVLWNGEVVFSSSGDESAWQQKTLKLTAQAGSNRIEFKGTGHNDGLGYILDNVVATSESSQQANAIREHATQNPATQNALSDKERAEADRQRLEQEKQKQLDAVAGSQSQLESTDQQALENNGQAQRDAVQEESEAITAELTKLAQGLDVLDGQATHTGESGDQWRNEFASGLLAGVQTQLDDAKQLANDKIAEAKQTHADNQNKVKDAVAKSEAGVAKGEQNRAGAEQDIADAQADAEKRKADALAKGKDAQQAESDAHHAVNNAQSRGDRDVQLAENKANQVQADAQGAKQNEGDRPDRQGVTGSGLSGNAHSVEGAGETDSHVKTDSQTNADGRFSEGLTEQEQEALEGATNAVNRLQINAGIRAKNSGSTITTMFTEANTDSIVVPTTKPQDVVRKEIRISGVNLEGLGEASHDSAVSLVAARAEKVANLYRWLDSDHPRATEQYIPVPGFERVDVNVSDETKQRLTQFVSGYIEHTDNQVPKDQAQALATLFVEATLNYDWDKRVEFLTKLESYGYSFEAPHGENSLVSFWSGRNFKEYRNVLDNAQPDGKKVVYDIDVQGNAFAIKLNKQLMRWGDMFLDLDNADQNHLQSSIEAAAYSNTGFWSSVYATGAKDDVYVIAEGGMRLGNYFWNVELPLLRQLQREGLVGEIRLLDKPVSEYKDVPVNEIGHKLTDAGVGVKVRFDALSAAQQAELLAINPKGYKADSLVELDVKLSAIDSMLRDALPFYSLRTERNLLVQEGDEGFKVRAWPGNDDKSKTIVLDNPEDATQQKTIERFILANFQNFEQMPDELFLVDNKVISHDKGITHVLAQKVDGVWLYNAKVDLMSVTELLDAANVTGKIRGESYQQVIDALSEYHSSVTEFSDYEQESIEKLLSLRKKIEGYVLGHPDSGRIAAMNSLLNQVNTRLEEVSVLAVSEPNIKAQDSFSRLYDQLETANLKGTKHLYLDQNGEFVTKGKGHLVNIDLLGNSEAVIEKVKLAVSNEYGQTIADTIFAGLTAHDLAKDGKGIDIAGLKKVHLAIEQHLSPVSATLFLWKPSDHSALGHAALQIGQGRNQINTDQALAYNQSNYVSWWPMGSKSSSLNHLFDVSSEAMPDLKLRWKDFSQPAAQGESLAFDMQSEENDDFGLKSAEDKLKDFIKQVASASGVDEKFKDISEAFTMMALMNPDILESANIPEHISKPFVDQWNDTSYDMQDVAQRFAKELQEQAKVAVNSEQMEQQISEVVRRFAQDELDKIQTFKEMQADQGRVFRINLEGLDVAAMQAEWHRLSNDSDARYQLLNKNCSSIVAKVLKAGGADKLIGHTWRPKFGVWTPIELFNFAQDLQEAQLVSHTKKDKQHIDTDSLQSTDRVLESLGESKQTTLDLSSVLTKDELKNEAKVFAKPIGESYQKILDQLDLLHATQDDKQLEAGLRLNNLVDDYVSSHEKSGRNTALLSLKNRVTESLYSNVAQESRVEIAKLSADRIDLAVDLLHRLRSSTNEVSSVVDIKSLADGTKYNSQESLAVLSKQEVPFNKDLQDQQLVQGRVTGEAVLNNVQLSDDEIKGIKWYTSEGFQYVNEALRKEEKLAYFVKDNAVNAVKGLSKLETFEGTVYRAFMPGVSLSDLASHVTPGQLFSDQGFTSTSTSTELAKSFRGGKGTVILTILDAKGTNVAGLAQLNQAEVLLKPGAHLRIEAVKETDQNLHIVAKYTEEFRAGEIVRNLFDGKTIGIAINQNTSTINESVVTSFDHDDITAMLKPKPLLEENKLGVGQQVQNRNVQNWYTADVTVIDGGDTRFDGQVIVQMENDPVVAKAAANLAGKHAESSVVVQLDSDGNYRVVYGDPSKLDGKLRWQLVGHGRDHSESNNTRLSGYSADELAVKLAKFQQSFNQAENINNKPDHISIVGCSLVSDDKQKGFGHQFINAMDANGLRVDVSVRSSELAVDEAGRKHTKDANGDWVQKAENNKVSLSWDAQGEVVAKDEPIRNGIAEGDIDLSRIGVSDVDAPARGAIGDNNDVFDAPEKRKPETEFIANSSNSNQLSYSGNIQVNVGEGEFTAVNWGTSNVGIKVGTGGFKSLAFGDNNVMVHIGDGESKHSVDIGGYQSLEGAQMFLGNRNVSFNFGHSNDLILMMDKSIPTPPLVNPFDGAARISGVLQGIAMSGDGEDWLAAQEQQWTLSGAKKFVKDMSGLDQSSSVDYTTLVELDSQNERDSRGLKHDAEATLNKQYNQWLSGNGNSGTSQLSRADKLRQANEKLAFNFAVGGQGADIQVTTGNWNFMFGDNIQSILDTNLGSLFGLMTQQFTATGQAKTTFTYTPQDLPRQLKNKLLGQLAGVGAETTLADIFGVDYTASGQIVSRNGQAVDGVAILKEMLEVIGEFSGDQLQAFVDPAKLLDSLKAGIDMGADGIKSFAETHGLKEKAPEEEKDNSSVSVNGANVNSAQGATVADGNTETAETQDRAFGFNSLNLPNVFATIFSQDKQKEMKSLVENLKQNLTADLLNMKEKTFDFLRNNGHLQGDGDINISLGNYNFNWGGDGKDLGAYLGDNNNFWGGRGDDVFYATGTSNIFTGGEGNDMGVLMGRENMMFGGDGNDTAVVAGRINHVFLGAGDDQSFVFGEGGEIDTGSGRDYVVTSGNFNRVDTGDDQDYSVTIGNNNQVELGAGNDFANIFGNYNRINAGAGNDVVKLMGYHAVLNGGDGDDHLIAAAISKFSQFNGGEGRDLMVLGGYQNTFKGGTDVDSFVVSGDVIDNLVEDIRSEDNIVFNGIDWQKLWFERSGYDLKLSILRDPSNDSDQSKFEHIGSVTFSDYFNGNRAQVVIGMSEKDLSGEREYTMLSDSAIDALIQAMSGFEPQAGDNGFIDSLESKSQAAISMAWSDVVHKKGLMV
ncbi:MARTX multifunctional-autoprocessing repeats-in-toxin holotoxin RtxA [Vibrio cholerae]|uniref:MARTX multifunctional-autoprocessing repeats-in-toxin holotoxin RtxA n=2 Tax=Vibrio cholerae TaxID=666 RepID=UPI00215F6A40|nr:MARTX multifunctional-autoprocessing repeats-in-toxin holotoxin RtxA [Vibrio cholerae]ELD3371452.1 MARTX multifunctional-autoprocessing repeats-in-toxin holotoxin RtxA [Vibrio cholerae]MCS0095723.1 MARTX multifunctional-autoprocessing repeats-in-toxin holotoxin RtxA [Vibrio cholerae]